MRWLAATLMALLALAYALIVLASPSAEVRPAPDDTGLGGLSSFAQTLKRMGYRVAFDPSTRPRLLADDVVVAPVLDNNQIPEPALLHVREGGRAYVIGVPSDLQPILDTFEAKDPTDKSANVDYTSSEPVQPAKPTDVLATATFWSAEDTVLSSLQQVGKGRIARLEAGALATNRFLARHDNARVALATLATIAKKGDRLVFVAGGYGEASSPGAIEAIGPGAVGALWQSLIVLAAFGLMRGIRFGLPVSEQSSRRGSRELIDAVASFYRRGKYPQAAVASAAKQHPDDEAIQAIAKRPKITEDEARRALTELDVRSRKLR